MLITFASTGAALLAFVIIGEVLTRGYIVLFPDRLDDTFAAALAIGVATALITIAALLWYRPKLQRELVVIIPALAVPLLFVGFMLAIPVATEFYHLYDFRHRPLTEFDGFVRVSRFHISRSYDLDLSDFSPSLSLYWDDYHRGAGHAAEMAITNGCIHVHLQRSGQALRMIQPEHVLVVRCPVGVGIIGAS